MKHFILWLVVLIGVSTAARRNQNDPSKSPVSNTNEPTTGCSASPEGQERQNIVNEFNEFIGKQRFLQIKYQNLTNPRGELYKALDKHMEDQKISTSDSDYLWCEFGNKIGQLKINGSSFEVNEPKIKELINSLPNVQPQRKESLLKAIPTCSAEQAKTTSCDLSDLYACFSDKCARG